ncbi:sugar transferase [Heyndrickxia ginsengihumi]|uniref:Sugar transferase n=1 Tax=Heyndrickxia ginsengihumi TaxID=363870 RepID=A0A0A6XW68_9BACI|nr:sugar transferase [Heyndrickxia ginsengihumi]KHD84372.1 UDP-phosphate N-acetylgalactosaminyl-1-phosphate transferase [Heyndrickxia ginsengihumi]MBE6185651.1 sugar transferase [Bacillus sp. (in: firmicutes)]MCM3024756.1 sugar transferase [Heyndrickxia ginsengihumi]NEY19424.1 sugar transferase [Heyndrickxia ginsengihumi]
MSAEKVMKLYKQYSNTASTSISIPDHAEHYLYLKRGFDLVVSIIGIIVALPIILICSLLIMIETPGSPFYIQERVGKNGKTFKLIKLRSMRKDAEKTGAKWAEANDPRITKVGAFIRKTRIDELPQLLSVLKGDMSIIGPRPERPMFTAQFDREIPGFSNRILVKPGLTGLAQVNGGYDLTPKEKLQYDLEYIEHLSPRLEMKIILKTFKVLLTGEGAR